MPKDIAYLHALQNLLYCTVKKVEEKLLGVRNSAVIAGFDENRVRGDLISICKKVLTQMVFFMKESKTSTVSNTIIAKRKWLEEFKAQTGIDYTIIMRQWKAEGKI